MPLPVYWQSSKPANRNPDTSARSGCNGWLRQRNRFVPCEIRKVYQGQAGLLFFPAFHTSRQDCADSGDVCVMMHIDGPDGSVRLRHSDCSACAHYFSSMLFRMSRKDLRRAMYSLTVVSDASAEAVVGHRPGITDVVENPFSIVFHLFHFDRDFPVQPFDFFIQQFFCDLDFRAL